jgi:bifunctional enzyme CysN/CysC
MSTSERILCIAGGPAPDLARTLAAKFRLLHLSGSVDPASHLDLVARADAVVMPVPKSEADRREAQRSLVLAHTLGVRHCFVLARGPGGGEALTEPVRLFALAAGYATVLVVPEDEQVATTIARHLEALPKPQPSAFRAVPEARSKGGCLEVGVLVGQVSPGDGVVLLPGAVTARVQTVSMLSDSEQGHARAALTLDPPPVDFEGRVLTHSEHRPEVADQLAAHLIWLDKAPLLPSRHYDVELAGQRGEVQVSTLKYRLDSSNLGHVAARTLEAGDVGFCNLSFDRELVFDAFESSRETGLARILDKSSGALVGLATIAFPLRRATNIHWQALAVDKAARAGLKGQRPACLWFTGLSGSGKSTVASLLEKRLHALGRHTYTLDGDNVRHGLNRDLGFTDADRVENIRRVAEVAKLFVDAGAIVMVSFISPFRAEREMARELFTDGEFIEIYVDTPIEVCEQRDPKGLYKKARAGQLKNFTGIDSVYEPPAGAEVILPGASKSAEALVEDVLAALRARGRI